MGNNLTEFKNKVRKPHTLKNHALSLGYVNPRLAAEWHPIKNGELTPACVSYSKNLYVWWRCLHNSAHEWEASVRNRSHGSGCPFCGRMRLAKENLFSTRFPELSKEWHPTRNGTLTPDFVSYGSDKRVWWQCSNNPKHEWETTVRHRSKGTGCPSCSKMGVSQEKSLSVANPLLAREWHQSKNGEFTPENVSYGSGRKVWWQCLTNASHEWEAKVYRRNSGNQCPFCAGMKILPNKCLKRVNLELAKELHPTKNNSLKAENANSLSKKKSMVEVPKR